MTEAPQLLIPWESRWHAFATAVRPALGRSPRPLEGECRPGMVPVHGMMVSWLLEAAALVLVITLPATLSHLALFAPPPQVKPRYDIIYFSGTYLPKTRDVGGAQAGHSGRSGGREALNRLQTIRVARGDSLVNRVVDVPKLKLPRSLQPVANLLAIAAPSPGPVPVAGLTSAPKLVMPQLAPVAPAPEIARNKLLALTEMAANVVQPAPDPKRDVAAMKMPQMEVTQVVPPPVSAPPREVASTPKLALPAPSVVAPPPENVGHSLLSMAGALLATVRREVVPPPVQPVGGGAVSGRAVSLGGDPAVVPPAPDVASGVAGGRKGNDVALGLLGGAGVALPPAAGGGGGTAHGVVISNQPGTRFGVPGNGGGGALAMSPAGGARGGLGGSGNGAGIGKGNGPGSGREGEGSGSASTGTGFGADPNAHGGISVAAGRGGAGNGDSGTMLAGVTIKGGTVNLPSFDAGADSPGVPGHTPSERSRHNPAITIIATSRSGGALNAYGYLKGDKVYTIYIDTRLGTAVLQFAAPVGAGHQFDEDLTAPEPVQADLPEGLPKSRLLIACVMDRSGLLRNLQVLQASGTKMAAEVMAALPNWRFRPALRGEEPVEVNAILGFDIDTR